MKAITKETLRKIYGIEGKLQLSENKNYPICTDYELIR
jgi:iron complex transport system ATP-binding protein